MDRLPPIRGARVRWLVEVDLGGRRRRYADGACDVQTAAGDWIPFVDGVAGDIEVTIGARPYTAEASSAEVSVELLPDVDVAALAAQGHRIHGARAEVSRWVEGTTYEERRVLIVGRVSEPEYGGAGESMSLSVADPIYEDRGWTSAESSRVDGSGWPEALSLAAAHLGLSYPIVIGRPGRVPPTTDADGWVPGSPARWVDHRANPAAPNQYGLALLVAGHHVRSRRVWGYVTSSPEDVVRLPVINMTDGRGQAVAVVPWYTQRDGVDWLTDGWTDPLVYDVGATYNYSAIETGGTTTGLGLETIPAPYQADDQEVVYLGWYDDEDGDTASGGLEVGGKLVRSAPDVLSYLLGLSSVPVDHGRIQAESAALGGYQIDAVIEERARVWDWIAAHLLPVLPVAVLTGSAGLYLRVWSPSAPVVAVIDLDDPEVDGSARLRVVATDADTQFVIRFARHAGTGDYLSRLTVGAEMDRPEGLEVGTYAVHPACDAARRAGVPLSTREIEVPVVYDRATAWRMLLGIADEASRPRRTIQVGVPESRYRAVDLWSVVRVVSARLSLDDRARVDELRVDGSGLLRLDLAILGGGA